MRIDRTHRPWLIGTTIATVLLVALYGASEIGGRVGGGGTPVGLFLGALALAIMVFEALLGLRKKKPIWRIGRTTTWMRAHLWVGLLVFPAVLLHAAFHAAGLLTGVLMALTILVVGSGVFGAWLQHTLPTRMMQEAPFETIYDQIARIRGNLLAEADESARRIRDTLAPRDGIGGTVTLTLLTLPDLEAEIAAFDSFYEQSARPYLMQERPRVPMAGRAWSTAEFERLRKPLPAEAAATLNALAEICEEKRQLDRQAVLHRRLHGWLAVHIPLSVALLLLSCVHAAGALRY